MLHSNPPALALPVMRAGQAGRDYKLLSPSWPEKYLFEFFDFPPERSYFSWANAG